MATANPLLINDPRFAPAGVLAPKSQGRPRLHHAHAVSWLAVNGTAAIVEFPGVLYRGGAEQKIRKYLIDNNYVDTVIQLPPDLFFGTAIATCIIVLKKSKKDNAVLFIDASAEFVKAGNKNKLLPEHQQKILDAFTARENADHFAKLVPNADLAENGYNIAVSSYVEAEDTSEAVDITTLNAEIAEIVARQAEAARADRRDRRRSGAARREPYRRPGQASSARAALRSSALGDVVRIRERQGLQVTSVREMSRSTERATS